MKIAIVVFRFPPKWLAGTEIASYNLAKHLAVAGHDVFVITSLDENLAEIDKDGNFSVHRVKLYGGPGLFGKAYFLAKTISIIKKIKPDIVCAQSMSMGVIGFFAKVAFKQRYAIYCRGSDIYGPSLFGRVIAKTLLKNADAVIALTQDMRNRIQSIYRREIFVVPNGFELKENPASPKRAEKFQINDRSSIIFVGTLRPVKGLQYLILAMGTVKQEIPNAELLIVGDGPQKEYLKELVRRENLGQAVSFAGKVDNEKIPEYLASSDIFVLPSLSEGFPTVLLEAAAYGLPIVATNVSGNSEIIKDGENGFLVSPEDPACLSDKITALLKNRELMGKISDNNKKMANEFSWSKITSEIKKIFSKSVS